MVEKPFVLLIDFYRFLISPLLPNSCRFYPTCSSYAREAIITRGIIKGGLLTIIRLSKCHPYHQGGFDPVPALNKQDK
ncbi:MAG: membrane protein insertion efficiency factor YidD [Deltaproteobacteria bacterium]|nr:membrane protein insertion efficiency factor YidD [Deltaproteobacteria bacterium]